MYVFYVIHTSEYLTTSTCIYLFLTYHALYLISQREYLTMAKVISVQYGVFGKSGKSTLKVYVLIESTISGKSKLKVYVLIGITRSGKSTLEV